MAPRAEMFANLQYEAFVLWWDSQTLAVFCPLCSSVEKHYSHSNYGKSQWTEPMTLMALCCSTAVPYRVLFPWNLHLGFEKNMTCKRFDTVGLDIPEFQEREGNRMQRKQEEQRQKVGFRVYPNKSIPTFSNSITLGDMRLLQSKRSKPNRIEILAPSATINCNPLPGPLAVITSYKRLQHKTIAVLDRRGVYPPIIAVSGWRDALSGSDIVINQGYWSEQVHILVEYISHKLQNNGRDKGADGRVSGCHAEKQVMAYVIRRHRLLEDGFEDEEMSDLKTVQLHQGLQEAWIAVSKKPCDDCQMFRKKIEAVCKIKFHFLQMQDDFRVKRDPKEDEETRTPIKSSKKRPAPLTPPNSGDAPYKPRSRQAKEKEKEEDGDDEDEEWEGQDPSPSHQRSLRSLARSHDHTCIKGNSHLFSHPLAIGSGRHASKRRRTTSWAPPPGAIVIDLTATSDDDAEEKEEQEYSSPSPSSDSCYSP